ncbi:transcriptional regulator, MarR family [Azospirillum oryzae]|uniref:Transcriptional regulator, MarR family n=2 Tax=Azospirillum oryzae TaxID=286727 RepID=A0A1X7HL77_9PROT|nr:transcriptional regulator, MarR family [Azospirillum oryzae]
MTSGIKGGVRPKARRPSLPPSPLLSFATHPVHRMLSPMSQDLLPEDGPHAGPGEADYVFSDQIGHLLRRAYQRHLAIFQRNACDPQLTSVQFVTLCAIRDNGPSSLIELVKSTAIDQATIRGIVDRLKARGLISQTSDAQDRRKVINCLTDEGRQLLEDMVPCAKRISELTMGQLNPAERLAVTHVLQKMITQDGEE